MTTTRMISTFALSLAMAGALLFATHGKVWPHDALPTAAQPLGWAYGWDCCSLTDCAQMPHGEIQETPQGYLVRSTGEVIAYGDKRLRQSKDEFFHRCAKNGDFKSETSLCLYTPDRGF